MLSEIDILRHYVDLLERDESQALPHTKAKGNPLSFKIMTAINKSAREEELGRFIHTFGKENNDGRDIRQGHKEAASKNIERGQRWKEKEND